ncbi:helix-turn-helix domain-containing protein [Phenylobacterium sp.]|uniref:helix-turn-helix domain-containing protein n=1 Tax=Phenylobacterium sp. TaxID=1871053 RepID=UPI00356AEED1
MLQTSIELLSALGHAVRMRRVIQGWSQAEAASRAGIGVRTWRRLEADGQATVETLVQAAIALRCEDNLQKIFPAPAAANLDDLLQRQAAEAARSPKRPRRPRPTS